MDYNLCDYNELKKLLTPYGFNFSKALGQNFIIDADVCPKMVEMLGVDRDTAVLEVGPGVGVLTKELCREYERFTNSALLYCRNDIKLFIC